MLLGGNGLFFGLKHDERADDPVLGFLGQYDFVDVAARRGDVRVHELLLVFGDDLLPLCRLVLGRFDALAPDDVRGAVGAHDGYFRNGPCEHDVRAQSLGVHRYIRAAVRFAHDKADLGNGGFGVRVQHLRAVADYAAVFLLLSGQERGHVHEGDDGNVEAVAEAYEAGGLVAGVEVERARHGVGLVGNHAHRLVPYTHEAYDDILGEFGLHFEEGAAVGKFFYDAAHVVRRLFVVGYYGLEARGLGYGLFVVTRRFFLVAGGQIAEQNAYAVEAGLVVGIREVRDAALRGMYRRAAELRVGDGFARHGLDDLRAGNVHLAGLLGHENEVAERGSVTRSAGAGAHDGRYLRHHAAHAGVAVEYSAVTGQRVYALFYSGAAAVVYGQEGRAHVVRHVHDAADLLRLSLAEAAAADGEVLRRSVYELARNAAVAGYDAVSGHFLFIHAEIGYARFGERVYFHERAAVEEIFEALARGHFARRVLLLHPCRAAARFVSGAFILKRLYTFRFPHCLFHR